MTQDADVIVIGSGIGGLVAGALLARYGRRVIICESHIIPGGAAHSFERQGFHFDSGPSFYCGLADPASRNPLRLVLDLLGESVPAVAYDPLGHYHFPDFTLPIHCNLADYQAALAQVTPAGAAEFSRLTEQFLSISEALDALPLLSLRADWQLLVEFARQGWGSVKLLAQLPWLQASVGDLCDRLTWQPEFLFQGRSPWQPQVQDPWLKRLLDLECFLLSGLKAAETIAPEVAFMFGERARSQVDYPLGGSGAIVEALVRGLTRWGGELRLRSPVGQILVERGRAIGVELVNGQRLRSPVVISNATLWDTVSHLLKPEHLPADYRASALAMPAVDSFMHLHLGLRSSGLEHLSGHHVVVHDLDQDITAPGNTCMISIPTVWDANLAPLGHHAIHVYTLEPYQPWQQFLLEPKVDQKVAHRTVAAAARSAYEARKQDRAKSLFRAVSRLIPDWERRLEVCLIGTPLTHARFLQRHQGTYGPAISAGQGLFPSCHTPIFGLYRVGDTTLPGIGVPAVVASGIFCANTLVSPDVVKSAAKSAVPRRYGNTT